MYSGHANQKPCRSTKTARLLCEVQVTVVFFASSFFSSHFVKEFSHPASWSNSLTRNRPRKSCTFSRASLHCRTPLPKVCQVQSKEQKENQIVRSQQINIKSKVVTPRNHQKIKNIEKQHFVLHPRNCKQPQTLVSTVSRVDLLPNSFLFAWHAFPIALQISVLKSCMWKILTLRYER